MLIAAVLLCSCSNGTEVIGTREGSTIIVDASNVRDTVEIPLSKWIKELEIVQLASPSQEAFVGTPALTISDNYIGTRESGQPYKLFDRHTGEFIRTIGHLGRGPGEYRMLYSSQIDEAADRVYLMPWTTDYILVYDLEGNRLDPIPLSIRAPKGHFRADSKNRKVIVSITPFAGSADKVVWEQDFEGNMIQGVDAAPFTLVPDYSNEVIRFGNTREYDFFLGAVSPVEHNGQADYLYYYNTGTNALEPVFLLNTSSLDRSGSFIFRSYNELPDYFIGNVTTITPLYVQAGQSQTYEYQYLFVNKKDLTGAWFHLNNDFLGLKNIEPSFGGGYYSQSLDPLSFIDILKEAEAKGDATLSAGRIRSLLSSLDEEGNNVLIIGKLK